MGLYDRDYYRDEELNRSGDLTESMVAKIIIANVVIYLIDMFVGDRKIMGMLNVPHDVWARPWELYRLLTAAFAHASIIDERGIMHITVNMFTLFMFGREVELRYGKREFLLMYLAFAVGASTVWVATHEIFTPDDSNSMLGASGAVVGIVLVFIWNFPHRMLAFPPIPAWAAGILIVGMDAINATTRGGLAGGDNVAFTAHLGGALCGTLYFKSGIRFEKWLPVRSFKLNRLWKRPPKLKVHDPERHYEEMDRRADEILEKVNRYGVNSITAEERRILDDYSRRMRQKHR